MNKEKLRLLVSKKVKDKEDIKEILDFVVSDVRSTLDINDSRTRLCKESSLALMNLCERVNIPYIPFNMGELGMKDLEHHYGITGFNTEYGQICILLDLTYVQFSKKMYPVKGSEVLSPGNFISIGNKEMLIKKGYITLTQENLNDYIESFIESYKLVNNINETKVYENIY